MRRFFWLTVLLLIAASHVFAKEYPKEKSVEWRLLDLYYYDAQGTMVRLDLAPKLAVRFLKDMSQEERASFSAQFNPVSQKPLLGDPSSILLEFSAETSPYALLETVNRISRPDVAEASPVFWIENIEAILEGIVVEPKTVLTAERLHQRMKKYGDFSLQRTFPEGGAWIFIVDEVKPPLNLLALVNLIHTDAWVKRASPRFKFLHDPLTAAITVEPVSGTVGEVRALILTIKIFDLSITLAENELPRFGEGLFGPIQGYVTSPSTIRYPPGYFFKVLEGPSRIVREDRRSRTYVFRWKFKHHALGEWIIPAQPVTYTKNGVTQEIKSSGFTLVVNSQIGSLNITDMPSPRPLIYPTQKLAPAPEVALPPVHVYWFDKWMRGMLEPERTARYTWNAAMFLGMASAGVIYVLVLLGGAAGKRKAVERLDKIRLLKMSLEEAQASRSYKKYARSFSEMLRTLFPHLSPHPTWEEIKDDERVSLALAPEDLKRVETIFEELGRRHMRNFAPAVGALAELDGNLYRVLEMTREVLVVGKEVP